MPARISRRGEEPHGRQVSRHERLRSASLLVGAAPSTMRKERQPVNSSTPAATVKIDRPERFWLACKDDVLELCDPDVEDGRQRHRDRDTINWARIGRYMERIGAVLRDACDRRGDVEVEVRISDGGFTAEEENVIWSWLSSAEAPRMDPGDPVPVDGRHRLWNVWAHSPDAILPIRSALLDLVDDVPNEDDSFAAYVRMCSSAMLTRVPTEIVERSPAYVAELIEASMMLFTPRVRPSIAVVDLTRTSPGVPRPTRLHSGQLDVHPSGGRLARYDCEVWQTHSDRVVAIVTNDIEGLSLINAAPRVFTTVRDRWPTAMVIEHWPAESGREPNGQDDAYFTLASEPAGGHGEVDFDTLAGEGIELRPR